MRRLFTIALDFLAPRRCFCCRRYDTWLCDACCRGLCARVQQVCYHCKSTPTPYGNLCAHCRGNAPLRSIFVATYCTDANKHLLSTLIHAYKYSFIRALAQPLSVILAHDLAHAPLPIPDIIIPVPLHARRLRWRGFNQSADLAQNLARDMVPHINIPVATKTLIRTRYTKPQVIAHHRTQRKSNLRNAFAITDVSAIAGKHILLVDDVATTGTTLIECARTLRASGAQSIDAIVLSRG